jgi:hypothetical protein
MKRNGLTTADDYKGAWAKAAKEREAYRSGKGKMAVTKDDIARVIHNLER